MSMFIIDCVSIPMLLAFTKKKKKEKRKKKRKSTNAIRVVLETQYFPQFFIFLFAIVDMTSCDWNITFTWLHH